jgi:hypothetical protein
MATIVRRQGPNGQLVYRVQVRRKGAPVRGEAHSGNAQHGRKELCGCDRAAPTARRLIRQAGDTEHEPV